MRILIDLIHPANIHYFRNFIFSAKEKGHEVIITARKKDVLQQLLDEYGLPYRNMGKGTIGKGGMGKMLYLGYAFFRMFGYLVRYRPKMVLSFGSTPCAYACFLLRIPHISYEDTEHAKLNRSLYAPVTPLIMTPACFYEDIGKNHYRFNAYMELFYLHPKRFKADPSVLSALGVEPGEAFILFRYVSWGAFHDIGQKGLTGDEKIRLVKHFGDRYKVFISSEGELPAELEPYRLRLPAKEMHNVLALSKLYIGEGGTTASEAAMLGVPSVYVNSLPLMGYLQDCRDSGLLHHLSDLNDIIRTAEEVLGRTDYDDYYRQARQQLIGDKIDPTAMLEWLVENYPESRKRLLDKEIVKTLKFE